MGVQSVAAAVGYSRSHNRLKSSGQIKDYVGVDIKEKRKRITFPHGRKKKRKVADDIKYVSRFGK